MPVPVSVTGTGNLNLRASPPMLLFPYGGDKKIRSKSHSRTGKGNLFWEVEVESEDGKIRKEMKINAGTVEV